MVAIVKKRYTHVLIKNKEKNKTKHANAVELIDVRLPRTKNLECNVAKFCSKAGLKQRPEHTSTSLNPFAPGVH